MGCSSSTKGARAALPVETLFGLCSGEQRKRIMAGTQATDRSDAKIVDAKNPAISATITADEADGRLIAAVAVILTQSDGFPDAVCVNDQASAAPGSKDRGLWQYNSKFHPTISDAIAFDPAYSTAAAYLDSDGFTDWATWTSSAGVVVTAAAGQKAKAGYESWTGRAVPQLGLGPVAIDDFTDPASPNYALDGLVEWAKGLGKLLSYITSAAFWRRFGTGALGIFLILVALVLVFATSNAGKTAAKAAVL